MALLPIPTEDPGRHGLAIVREPNVVAWVVATWLFSLYIVELNESYVVPKDYFVAEALEALAAELLP